MIRATSSTAAVGWLSRFAADVPSAEDWLGERERRVLSGFRVHRRRSDWLLGRWTGKAAVAGWLGVEPSRVEVLAASDGAPEAWVGRERLPLSLSLSHRAGRAIAAVAGAGVIVGCDLELIEERSGAFMREWFSPAEQALVAQYPEVHAPMVANLLWSAKEAAAKVRREGLRLDPRHASVELEALESAGAESQWQSLRVDWDGGQTHGWWCVEQDWVLTVAADSACAPPRLLDPIDPTP